MTTTTQKRAAAVRRQEWDSARRAAAGVVTDAPKPGWYVHKVTKGTKRGAYDLVPVRIFHDSGVDPVTGEPMDRTAHLRVQLARHDVEPDWVWPYCGRFPIPEHDWRCLIAAYPERSGEGWHIQWHQ